MSLRLVVNCFQFVIWRSLTHLQSRAVWGGSCCELLSICDLTIFDTPLHVPAKLAKRLWIAFNLWFDDLWHTQLLKKKSKAAVVNCFQFVIWRSLTHPTDGYVLSSTGCELLSICDLTIFDTPKWQSKNLQNTLWIAFNLGFDDLWHTSAFWHTQPGKVVNCFQFVIWRSLTHRAIFLRDRCDSCELLSICDLTIFDTPMSAIRLNSLLLWIAFNLWFDDLWHTANWQYQPPCRVVNCFQFVIWRSLTHR